MKKIVFLLLFSWLSYGQQHTITAAEYFWGIIDPGNGSAIALAVEDGAFNERVESVIATYANTQSTAGSVLFNIRVKDGTGKWGPLFKKVVFPYGSNPSPNLIQQGDTIAVCPGSSVTLDYAGPNGYTPTWFDGTQGQSITFTPSSEGNYSVTATLGNSSYTDDIAITFKTLLYYSLRKLHNFLS